MNTQQVNKDVSSRRKIIWLTFFSDCSRFWECSYPDEACLYECLSCDGSSLCEGKETLSFDVRYQYPVGPVCDWPQNVDCSRDVCDEMDPRPECCQDSDCQNDDIYPDAYCSTSFNCVYPDSCGVWKQTLIQLDSETQYHLSQYKILVPAKIIFVLLSLRSIEIFSSRLKLIVVHLSLFMDTWMMVMFT